jgi:hypothetical protein
MLNKHQVMTSSPLLSKCMGVFIFILINVLLLMHIPLSHVIRGFYYSHIFWRAPKFLNRPKRGQVTQIAELWRTRGTLPALNTKGGG